MPTDLHNLRTRINHLVRRCPPALIDQTIIDICRKFCEETRIWQEQLCSMSLEKGIRSYLLELDDDIDGDIYRVLQVCLDGDPDSDDQTLDLVEPTGYEVSHGEDGPTLIFCDDPGESIDGGLIVTVAVRPKLDSLTLPTALYNDYYAGLAAGTVAEIMAMPDKRWSASAGYVQQSLYEYDQAVRNALNEVELRHTTRDMVIKHSARGSFQLI